MTDPSDSDDPGGAADRPQDPLVSRHRPDPSQLPDPVKTLEGALGDSDRPGFRRIYFTTELDYYAEFRSDDVVGVADIPADQPPFLGEPATRVTVRRDAVVEFTRTQHARPMDEFDLDVRLAGRATTPAAAQDTFGCGDTEFFGCTQFCTIDAQCGGGGGTNACPPPTGGCETVQITICRGATCIDVCETRRTFCEQATCETCRTRCGQNTCRTCGQATCQTCGQATCQTCNQATCQTCNTACGQATCQTCRTRCDQDTCQTCETRCGTCNPHVFTCGGQCEQP